MAKNAMNLAMGIPAFQAATTLPLVVSAIRAQQSEWADFLVWDDASSDTTAQVARDLGLRLRQSASNLGRGAVRAAILEDTRATIVFMCDATQMPEPGFVVKAIAWLQDECVAGVFGRVLPSREYTVVERWKARHLYRSHCEHAISEQALLATGVCALRRSAVEAVGGFDPMRRSGEDADLGRRLLAAGWKVVFDPNLQSRSIATDTISSALVRYARWNSPAAIPLRGLPRQLAYAIRVMTREDLRQGDYAAALLSLMSPFYQLFRR